MTDSPAVVDSTATLNLGPVLVPEHLWWHPTYCRFPRLVVPELRPRRPL